MARMENSTTKKLVETIHEYIENPAESKTKPRDLLMLCTFSMSQRKMLLSQLKHLLSEKLDRKLENIRERLLPYENSKLTVFGLENFAELVSWVYNPNQRKKEIFTDPDANFDRLCVLTVENVKCFRETIESNLHNGRLLTNYLLPINKKVYFLDQKLDYFEFIFQRRLFKMFKTNLESLETFVQYCLLISKQTAETAFTGVFLSDLKYFFGILKKFGIKRRVLKTSKLLLIKQDITLLSDIKNDFNLVLKHFESQGCVFSSKLQNEVEKSVLYKLYATMELETVAQHLMHLDRCHAIYSLLLKADLKDRLLDAFALLLPKRPTAKSFTDFLSRFRLIQEILKKFNDEDFNRHHRLYTEKLLVDQQNCIDTAVFVNDALRGNQTGTDLDFNLIATIIDQSPKPEMALSELQKKLALRLLEYKFRCTDSSEIECMDGLIKQELGFLANFKNMHSENMRKMVEDFRLFVESKKKNESSTCLLMTMCKWPVFRSADVNISPENPIFAAKAKISNQLKSGRKLVNWVDTLSTVVIELFGKKLALSLFQYAVILQFVENGSEIEKDQYGKLFNQKSVYSAYSLKKASVSIPDVYKAQFNCLLEDLIILRHDLYILNPFFTNMNYLGFKLEFDLFVSIENTEISYNKQASNEARISKLLKRIKRARIADIMSAVEGLDEEELKNTLKRLREKEIVEITDDCIAYCP